MGRVPKKGLGVVGTDSAFGLGDTDAEGEVTLGFGDEELGLKAFALGFGLKDEAFTFKRLFAAVVGDIGVMTPAEPEPEPEPELGA